MIKVTFAINDGEVHDTYCHCTASVDDIFKETDTGNIIVGFELEGNFMDFILSKFMEARVFQVINRCFDIYYVKFEACDNEGVFDLNMKEMSLEERIDNIFV